MAIRKTRVVVPTTSALTDRDRLPSTSLAVIKTLLKISRASLLSLVLEWLSEKHQSICPPYLVEREEDDEGSLYPAASTSDELREVYEELQAKKGSKKEVVDRVAEGDWRHGVTMIQLAMADVQYLVDHPTSQKWIALKLARADTWGQELKGTSLSSTNRSDLPDLPRLHAPTFLANLQREIGPLVKAHYHLTRPPSLPLALLRVQIYDIPYNGKYLLHDQQTLKNAGRSDRSRTVYIAFPDGAPFVYVSIATAPGQPAGGEGRNLRKIVLDALPKAVSRPQARYCYQPTSLSAKSLTALLALRGSGRGNAAPGGWSIFADGSVESTPLDRSTSAIPGKRKFLDADDTIEDEPSHVLQSENAQDHQQQQQQRQLEKRRKIVAKGRFGNSGVEGDTKGLERLEIRIEDPISAARQPVNDASTTPLAERDVNRTVFPGNRRNGASDGDEQQRPQIRLTFHGTHVFAGIRKLVEKGIVDGDKMPGWMTGEAGVSVGVVRNGRMLGKDKASGS